MALNAQAYVNVLQTYMDALGRSDYIKIKSLFSPGGMVKSPFLGEMPAAQAPAATQSAPLMATQTAPPWPR